MKEFKDRVLIPLLVPLGALAIIVVVVLNVSRILLALEERSGPHTVTALAIIWSAAFLFGFTWAATRDQERSSAAMSLMSVAGIMVIIAGFIGFEAIQEDQTKEKEQAAANAPSKPDVTIEAFDIGFKEHEVKIGPGKAVIQEKNEGATAHTLVIEGLTSGRKLSVPQGGATDQATFDLTPGTYTYYCDIPGHRGAGMEGKLIVDASAPPPGAGGGGGGAAAGAPLKIDAADLKLTPKEETVAAGPVSVTYDNTGAITHTLVNEQDPSFKKLSADSGKTVTETWQAKPGTYTFYCDVPGHRGAGMEMKVTVK